MVRFANNNDFSFAKKSWKVCFDDSDEFINWNFKFNYHPQNTIIAEVAGENASIMQFIPYTLKSYNTSFNIRYISGVATMPQHRGKGLVKKMFEFYDNTLNCTPSILIPAVNNMYEKFGYKKLCDRKLYSITSIDTCDKITNYTADLYRELDCVYKLEMSTKDLYIDRTPFDWEKILTDLLVVSKGALLVNREADKIIGYAIAYPKSSTYEIWEICGNIELNVLEIDAPPILAKNIDEHLYSFKNSYINMLL